MKLPKLMADYDQFDAAIRDAWRGLTQEQKEEISAVAHRLKQEGEIGSRAAVLLVWATCTMRKRDAEDRYAERDDN